MKKELQVVASVVRAELRGHVIMKLKFKVAPPQCYLPSLRPEPSPVAITAGKRKADSPAPIHFRELLGSALAG